MKRLILIASFAVLFTPYIASARDWNEGEGRKHPKKIRASEMATAGFAVAALVGVAGYLVLRKRNTA